MHANPRDSIGYALSPTFAMLLGYSASLKLGISLRTSLRHPKTTRDTVLTNDTFSSRKLLRQSMNIPRLLPIHSWRDRVICWVAMTHQQPRIKVIRCLNFHVSIPLARPSRRSVVGRNISSFHLAECLSLSSSGWEGAWNIHRFVMLSLMVVPSSLLNHRHIL